MFLDLRSGNAAIVPAGQGHNAMIRRRVGALRCQNIVESPPCLFGELNVARTDAFVSPPVTIRLLPKYRHPSRFMVL